MRSGAPCAVRGWGSTRGEGEGVGDGGLGGGGVERERVGGAMEPALELIHVPRAGGVAGLAEDEVESRAVGIAEAGGEALRGAEGVAGLLDGGEVAALGLRTGAGGHAEEEARQQSRVGEDGVLDVEREGASLLPCS